MTSDARSSAKAMKTLAGLAAGAPALLVPEVALAATDNVVLAASVSGVTGAALGTLVAGGIGYAIYRRDRRELEQTILRLAGPNAAPQPVAPVEARPESVTIAESVAVAESAIEAGPEPARPRFELIDALPAEPLRIVESLERPAEPAEPERSETPRASVDLSSLPDPLATPAPGRHDQVRPADVEVAPGHGSVVSSEGTAKPYVPPTSNPYLAAEASESHAQARREPQQSFDYEDFAVDYVAKKSLKERMTLTAMGVAAVLTERMGRNMMDGVPVIERADGSVGDVGTTWWERDQRVQRSPQPTPARPVAPAPQQPLTVPAAEAPTGSERSQLIISRVAPIEEEAYPEIGFEWHRQQDTWESALAALDDRVEDNLMAGREERARRRAARRAVAAAEPRRVVVAEPPTDPLGFSDAVGAIDTIDEPDGLERDTQFLNFRAPGNHPEVQDTGSYINYLIEDEFKRNPSSQVRRQARSYLRVHEGGQNTRAQEAI